jgi:AAA-ATPase Vps4-associated protein 1
MAAPLPNTWHLRRVADKNAKACWICYKASSSVLITPDSKVRFVNGCGYISKLRY